MTDWNLKDMTSTLETVNVSGNFITAPITDSHLSSSPRWHWAQQLKQQRISICPTQLNRYEFPPGTLFLGWQEWPLASNKSRLDTGLRGRQSCSDQLSRCHCSESQIKIKYGFRQTLKRIKTQHMTVQKLLLTNDFPTQMVSDSLQHNLNVIWCPSPTHTMGAIKHHSLETVLRPWGVENSWPLHSRGFQVT